VDVDDVDWRRSVDPECGDSGPKRESDVLAYRAQGACAANMLDRQSRDVDVVDGFGLGLMRPAQADDIHCVAGLHGGAGFSLGAWFADGIV
jgi:hypothetical protein